MFSLSLTFCSVSISSLTRLTPPEAVSQSMLVEIESPSRTPSSESTTIHEFTQVLVANVCSVCTCCLAAGVGDIPVERVNQ